MGRRVGLSSVWCGVQPELSYPVSWPVPEVWTGRGRWRSGPMHTFVDDYRQEFFWRRPEEGLIVAVLARVCTAPDFTVYTNDPQPWREYQAWRSAVVGAYWWRCGGVRVLPVVSFGSGVEYYCAKGSTWAVRGPARGTDERAWLCDLAAFLGRAEAGRLVVFGRTVPGVDDVGIEVVHRLLSHQIGEAA